MYALDLSRTIYLLNIFHRGTTWSIKFLVTQYFCPSRGTVSCSGNRGTGGSRLLLYWTSMAYRLQLRCVVLLFFSSIWLCFSQDQGHTAPPSAVATPVEPETPVLELVWSDEFNGEVCTSCTWSRACGREHETNEGIRTRLCRSMRCSCTAIWSTTLK